MGKPWTARPPILARVRRHGPRLALSGHALALAMSCVPAAALAEDVSVRLVASRSATLSAEISARVQEVAYREGEIFSEGDLLVAMDCSLYEARRARTEAVRNRGMRRLETLEQLSRSGATSGLELATARFELDAAEAELRLADAEIDRCRVTAPFSGAVVATRINAHEHVSPGQPLIEIIDLSTIEAETFVPSHMLSWLHEGARFEIMLAEISRPLTGEVERISPAIDPVTQSVSVYGRLLPDDPGLVLRSGMSGIARFETPAARP
ncbi:MAG: efflux RND transporter periplasmic adaptor subunit [Roseicyclus sp.]|nr:efflux RND transporter periplasmic adaptor subunit [Roseicyclus sp.]